MSLKKTLKTIKEGLKPKIELVKGTRLASFMFIFLALLIATGALFAANTYYDLDTQKIVTEDVQRATAKIQATAGLLAGGGDETLDTATEALQVTGGDLVVGNNKFTVATTGNTYVGGTTTFATSVDVQGTLDPNYMAAYTLSGDITGTSSPNITGIGTFSGATATLASVVQSPEFTATSGTTTIGSGSGGGIVLDPETGTVKLNEDNDHIETAEGYEIGNDGNQKLVGMEPILGFDFPVRCSSVCSTTATTVSRTVNNYPFDSAPTGADRVHKFVISYADTMTSGSSTWVVVNSGETNATFTVPAMGSDSTSDFENNHRTYITPTISNFSTSTSWEVRVKTGISSDAAIQVNEIYLAAYDELQ